MFHHRMAFRRTEHMKGDVSSRCYTARSAVSPDIAADVAAVGLTEKGWQAQADALVQGSCRLADVTGSPDFDSDSSARSTSSIGSLRPLARYDCGTTLDSTGE